MIEIDEAKEIIISVFAISLALGIVFAGIEHIFSLEFVFFIVPLLVTIGSGFILHEMGHKLLAMHYGTYARFRMWTQGLLFMLATSTLGVLFAAPGAVYIYARRISKKKNAYISLIGPVINLGLALFFIFLSEIIPVKQFYSFLLPYTLGFSGYGISRGFFDVWQFGAAINIVLAMFNMIPAFPLDGSKVFRWSKKVWIISIIILLTMASWIIGPQAMVSFAIMFILAFIISKLLFG